MKSTQSVSLALALACAVLGLAGCNGGTAGGGTVDTIPALSRSTENAVVARGIVSGLSTGSVTLNGLEFDISQAAIEVSGAPGAADRLATGQYLTVSGRQTDGRYIADRMVYNPDLAGAISAVDLDTNRFSMVDRTIRVGGDTVFSGVADLSGLAADDAVEVSGVFDADGVLHASFVRRTQDVAVIGTADAGLEAAPGDSVSVAGMVDEIGADGWFAIGGVQVHFGEGTTFVGGRAVGLNERLLISGTMNGDGSLEAVTIEFTCPE
jgi:hypothetical protein